MAEVDAPAAMDFSVGTTEQKMDMSLDDIIKQSKKANAKTRVPNKGRNKQPNGPAAKAALQKSVASRSSSMRQGKFAEARARNSGAHFPATQAASKRAFSAPINTRNRQIMKNDTEVSGRPAFSRKRNFQRAPNTFPVAARNIAVSVVNNASKVGAGRAAGNPRRRNAAPAPAVAFRQVSEVPVHNSANHFQSQPQRPKTLDSLFASIRNTPQQVAPKFNVQQGGRRRGGGAGGGGRGRGRGQSHY
ncbi:hypothetical protein KC19_VG334400 [Ceratodon purpureus]|uniref:Uncharacterized protein n=1 Tax=Ceratodon purpureus TaxID=3225 RepID=A0A8T0HX42_CERPU|nr:hypothetical protein KC19_VG334400 [Ceratodon purpureus]